ncbi:uncharacterized protein [Coffea arabica]|uniref:Uncharacterized protein isoform X1 n=2 Tax=Coffea arabica TaxID=13443 RepID=A0ABM4X9F5_COFAR
MYPKVKVREQEDYDDQYEFETRSLQSLKTPECFSLNDFSSPDNSPTSVVRVPRFDSSTSVSSLVIKGAISNRKQKLLEENKTNIRASPIPRPRAVLSSPDNDQMIGSKNKPKGDILASMKRQSLFENRHARCKVTPRPVAADGSISTRTSLKEVPDGKGDLRTRQRTVITDSNLRLNLQKGKPKSVKDRVTE